MKEASNPPVFVAGPSRSGTAMVRSMLNNHSAYHLTGETHYFDDLRVKLEGAERSPLSEIQVRQCEDYFLALTHRPYGHQGDPERGWLDRSELRKMAESVGVGSDAYFEAYCRLNSRRSGKLGWGEKTPRHIYRIPDIAACYPDSRFVCMIRDPRAIVASYRDWKNQGGFDLESDPTHGDALAEEEARTRRSYHIIIQSMLWRGVVQAALSARARFGEERVMILRYEDVVGDARGTSLALARWLGVEHEDSMLDVPMHNSSFSTFDESSGVSTAPLRRWRERLSDAEIAVIQDCCGGLMRELGYEMEAVRAPLHQRLKPWITLPFVVIQAARANRERIGSLPAYIWLRLRLATGLGAKS